MNEDWDFKKIKVGFDIDRLRANVIDLIASHPLHVWDHQLALNHPESCRDPWYFGSGQVKFIVRNQMKPYVRSPRPRPIHELEFSRLNSFLENTYLGEVYGLVKTRFKIGRCRIIGLKKKTCLSWHKDLEKRLHIPILTNPSCKIVIEDHCFHLPADGNMYLVNTRNRNHTVFNGWSQDRLHLVFTLPGDV